MNLPEPTTDPVEFDCRLHEISEKVSGWPRGEAYCCLESYKFACYKLLIEQAHVRSDALSELARLDANEVENTDDIVINDLKRSHKRSSKFDKVDCSDTVLEPDYELLQAIETVLRYYMTDDEWVEWKLAIKEAQLTRKE